MVKKEFYLKGLGCANCAAQMESEIKKLDGVEEASVNFATAILTVQIKEQSADHILSDIEKIVHSIESHVSVLEKNPAQISKTSLGGEKSFEKSAAEDKISWTELVDKKKLIRIGIGFFIYLIAVFIHISHTLDFDLDFLNQIAHNSWIEWALFLSCYILIGGDVVYRAFKSIFRGKLFDENFLLTIATVGAFLIGDFSEAVAVMIFYQIGLFFQEAAVNRSRKSIYKLMDIRPDYAHLNVGGFYKTVSPKDVSIGDTIIVKPGEKVPLDGTVIFGRSFLDVSTLTGEFVPKTVHTGDSVLSGSINKSSMLTIRVDKTFENSAVSKILDLVENASSKKSQTEKFITKFSRYYTPAVILAAAAVAFIPPLILPNSVFSEWLYRGLIFLVISCPCALVISIPLSYFGGIGASSKKGILVKGSNYLEGLTQVKTVIFDKTGTLSKGVFNVVRIDISESTDFSDFSDSSDSPTSPVSPVFSEKEILTFSAAAESFSNHPIALSIVHAAKEKGFVFDPSLAAEYNEFSGLGIQAVYDKHIILIGNEKLMSKEKIETNVSFSSHSHSDSPSPSPLEDIETHIYVAVNGKLAGRIAISDEVKEDSKNALSRLKKYGIEQTVMITGDTNKVGQAFAADLGIDVVYTQQLPHQKTEVLEQIQESVRQKNKKGKVVFVGDGLNDAPSLMRADIGIAVGGVGNDAAVEAADIVLMTGAPSQLADSFEIAKKTKAIVYQNIIFALGVKVLFLALGALGYISMWQAAFADVGVSLIAILNAVRLLKIK